jgi:prefoldin subunit 5
LPPGDQAGDVFFGPIAPAGEEKEEKQAVEIRVAFHKKYFAVSANIRIFSYDIPLYLFSCIFFEGKGLSHDGSGCGGGAGWVKKIVTGESNPTTKAAKKMSPVSVPVTDLKAATSCVIFPISSEIFSISSEIEKISAEMEKISEEIELISAEMEKNSAEMEKNSAEMEKISEEMEKISEEMEKISAEMGIISEEIEKISGEMEKISEEMEKISGEMGTLSGTFFSLSFVPDK